MLSTTGQQRPLLWPWRPVWPDLAIYWTLGNFLKPLATNNLPKSPTFLGNFCKGVKIFNFSSEIIFRQLLLKFGDFFWSHWRQYREFLSFSMVVFLDTLLNVNKTMRKQIKLLGQVRCRLFIILVFDILLWVELTYFLLPEQDTFWVAKSNFLNKVSQWFIRSCGRLRDPKNFMTFLKNGPTPASFSFIFRLFKQTSIQIIQQINVKNVYPVYGTGIQTHGLMQHESSPITTRPGLPAENFITLFG